MKCLLIETKDKRKFLTEISNLPLLKEFIQKFQIKTSKVIAEKKDILSIDELAKELCESGKNKELKYQKTKKEKVSIQDFVLEKIKNKENITLDSIKKELKTNVSDQTLYYHIRKAKSKIENKNFVKIKEGIKKKK